jgi:hypothetical protein
LCSFSCARSRGRALRMAYAGLLGAFTDDPSEFHRLDWSLLQNGAVVLYLRQDVLEPDVAWLQQHAYEVKRLDCLTWISGPCTWLWLRRFPSPTTTG